LTIIFKFDLNVATMYVDSDITKGKYPRHLIRQSYRENGKVKHRTIANISHCSDEEVEAIRLALRHKSDLAGLISAKTDITLHQGLSVGSVLLLSQMAKKTGIEKALGKSRDGKLALWQIIARVIDQGSRLSAVRLATAHAACDILDLEKFDEEDLYKNLDWICDNQERTERLIFKALPAEEKSDLYLYDVTSSYLEGQKNELGAFGYNRDKKKGKKQIVIGLLCDQRGNPLSTEVFRGNTQDTATFASQVKKVANQFGGGDVVFVGDRGMIKSKQIEDIRKNGFRFITAITKPQIESLVNQGTIRMELFDDELAEIESEEDGFRYIIRRNPVRAQELHKIRADKQQSVINEIKKYNQYLSEHPRSKVETALRKVNARCEKLGISRWLNVFALNREIVINIDTDILSDVSEPDGCYVLKTDLRKVSKEIIHDRYKDLSLVEWAFRSCKTVELEMRPVNVRLEKHTKAHAFVVMLAYRIVKELHEAWKAADMTAKEGIRALSSLCATEVMIKGKPAYSTVPKPRDDIRKLFDLAKVRVPGALPCKGVKVATKKKLNAKRK
jgi:transposase